MFCITLRTKYQTYWRSLAFFPVMAVEIAEIQQHLPFVCRLEFSELKVDCYQSAQSPVVKQQVKPIIHSINRDAFLSVDKCEIRAELFKELLNLIEYRCFQIAFAENIRQSEHVKKITAAEYHIRL